MLEPIDSKKSVKLDATLSPFPLLESCKISVISDFKGSLRLRENAVGDDLNSRVSASERRLEKSYSKRVPLCTQGGHL